MKYFRNAAVFLLLLVMCLAGSGACHVYAADVEGVDYTNQVTFKELEGKRAGVMTGTPQDQMVKACIENPVLEYYNDTSDTLLALSTGKIDYMVNSTITFRILKQSNPDLMYVNEIIKSLDIGAIFPKTDDGKALCAQFNEYLAKKDADGSLHELLDYWFYPKDWENFEIPAQGENGILTFATCSSNKPFAMVLNEQYAGFDVAVVAGFCQEYGYGLRIEDSNFAGMLAGITSGKYQIAAGQIAWTAERAESVLYSDFYCSQDIVPIISAKNFGIEIKENESTGSDSPENSSQNSFARSFHKTFIEQSRWKIILSGLLTTLFITVFGFLLANVLGAIFCMMALSHNKLLHILADIYSQLMQGLPIMVILMILYYVVFTGRGLSGSIVSIIGFGLVSGAYMAQIFESGIRSVNPGEIEASLALGFTRKQTLRGVVIPQAVRRILPAYFSQLISLMKGTAIVGYIAVVDLTKAGDIVRGQTFEAFFSLISVAIIYFAIASILLLIMKMIQKKLTPKRVKSRDDIRLAARRTIDEGGDRP